MLLEPGETCWRRDTADRAALLIDIAAYFDAAMKAMRKARHTLHLLNWAFEPQTLMHPQPGCTGPDSDRIGNFLIALAEEKPDLDVRVLCWKSALPIAATQKWFTFADRKKFAGTKVKFVFDGKLPLGACHHQKLIVIDEAIGFCGGGDIGPDRWDTPEHLDDDPRRRKTRHAHGAREDDFDSRHETMGLVAGAPARALGELFRARWLRATGETLLPPPPTRPAWPAGAPVQFKGIEVGLSRTMPAWRGEPEVREVERLHLTAIAAARRCIYMENQYFTSPLIASALAARLRERDGPEVILVGTAHSPSYFDQATMDRTRVRFLETLKRADAHGRFQAYSPVTTLGRLIIVHSKLTIVDDRLLRIGSANVNNRSLGFDTECDMSFEARDPAARRQIDNLRTRLFAHWLGCGEPLVESAIRAARSPGRGLEALRKAGHVRLRPMQLRKVEGLAAVISAYHVGDPFSPRDSWLAWRRKAETAVAAARGRATMLQERRRPR